MLHNSRNDSSVYDDTDRKNPITFNITLGDGGKTLIKFGQGNASGLNVYASLSETINFAEKYLSENEFKLIKKGFDSFVDINQECNAFYNGSLNFLKQSSRCANTGLISDIVKHEWGHGLDDYLGPTSRQNNNNTSGITDAAYSEGIGDVLAAYMSRSPDMAKGLFLNDPKALRNLQNNRVYPPANIEEAKVHSLGLVVGGAFWDLHTNLTKLYGAELGNDKASRLFFRHLMTSDRYLDAYQAVLRVDDEDNNPMTRSSSYCAITRAFSRHNITGGEKVGDDCVDKDVSIKVKVDQDLGDGKLRLILSAGGSAKIVACPGKATSCQKETVGYLEFLASDGDDLSTIKGIRKFYSTKDTIDARSNSTYTFFSQDSTGTVLAKRELEFKTGSTLAPTSLK